MKSSKRTPNWRQKLDGHSTALEAQNWSWSRSSSLPCPTISIFISFIICFGTSFRVSRGLSLASNPITFQTEQIFLSIAPNYLLFLWFAKQVFILCGIKYFTSIRPLSRIINFFFLFQTSLLFTFLTSLLKDFLLFF